MRSFASFAVLLLLAACGGHPLEGYWAQELEGGGDGVLLEFNLEGNEIMGHCEVNGEHRHIEGTYLYVVEGDHHRAVTLTLTGNAELLGCKDGADLQGTLVDDRLEFGPPENKVVFHKTDKGPGH